MDESPAMAVRAECFFHRQQRQTDVSRLLALLTGPRGTIKDLGRPWAALPIQKHSVTAEMKMPPGQLLVDQGVKAVGWENKTETSLVSL